MSKVIRKSCGHLGRWEKGKYSIDWCNANPGFLSQGCEGCELYATNRQCRISTIKAEIAELQKELAVLTKGKKENNNGND